MLIGGAGLLRRGNGAELPGTGAERSGTTAASFICRRRTPSDRIERRIGRRRNYRDATGVPYAAVGEMNQTASQTGILGSPYINGSFALAVSLRPN